MITMILIRNAIDQLKLGLLEISNNRKFLIETIINYHSFI